MSSTGKAVVLCTAPSLEVAEGLAHRLVEERLAACVNLIPSVKSIYRWEGAVHCDGEVLMVMKTQSRLFEVLRDRILSLHPYEVPEVIALDLTAGSAPYLAWIDANTLS
jgi:periplasmic divalent cation tolerance protein